MTNVITKPNTPARPKGFQPGNKLASGNPNAKRQYELRRMVLDAIDPGQLREAVGKLQSLAVAGDLIAMRLYLEYAIGKPTQPVELAGPDGAPIGADLGRVTAVILAALAGHPEARSLVADQLRVLAPPHHTVDDPPEEGGASCSTT